MLRGAQSGASQHVESRWFDQLDGLRSVGIMFTVYPVLGAHGL
jgi:hypothetical protein